MANLSPQPPHPQLRRQFVDGQYGQLHTRICEPEDVLAAPVVCLHMSPKSGRLFAEVMPHLAADRMVLAPDYPGHGESDLPPAEPEVRIEDFAADVWRVVDQLAKAPVHFVGHHTGSMVAVEAASQRPTDVLSITCIGAPVFTDEDLERLHRTYAPIPIDEAGTRFRIMWERVLHHRGPGMTLQMAATSMAENLRAGDHYEWGHRAAFAYGATYRHKLAELRHPVLVMNPADDCFEQSKRADALLINGRRQDYPAWGHGFLSAHAAEASRELLSFIHEVERSA
ncbi:MAG: alpha/beta fold hydrolase [Pseudomonadota bacterium]